MFGFQHDFVKWLVWFLVIFLTLLVSESIGLLFSMITVSADLALIFMSLIFIVLLSLTGFLASSTPVYYEWIEHINYIRCDPVCIEHVNSKSGWRPFCSKNAASTRGTHFKLACAW